MQRSLRAFVSAIATLTLVAGLAAPAAAEGFNRDHGDQEGAVPIVVDALLLRPLGLMTTLLGAVVYVFPVAPFVAVTRPTDLGKPLGPLVATPARFTFRDPLGQH